MNSHHFSIDDDKSLVLIGGGNGASVDDAVIIKASSTLYGAPAENDILAQEFGRKDIDWKVTGRRQLKVNSRQIEQVEIVLSNGTRYDYYFDITSFFGKY
ncbi:MAG: hypothetical protein HUU54_03985 [Ignavibacteriaceae bacterium]|nr:hypothetical protein [Ignavibacteriaceae bacterium]